MPTYTVVATTATQGSEEAEFDVHVDEFDNESETIGYARRMAEEMFGLAEQLQLDFDYSHVSLYKGDVGEDEPDSEHPGFVGMWFFDENGAGYVTAAALRSEAQEDGGADGGADGGVGEAETAPPAS